MPLHLGAPELPCQARLHLLALRSEVSQLRSPLAAFGPRGKPAPAIAAEASVAINQNRWSPSLECVTRNGHALCGARRRTSRIPSPWNSSFVARVASTNVPFRSPGALAERLRPEPQDSQWAALSGRCWGKVNLFFRQPGTPLWVVFQKMPQRHKQLRSMSHSPLVQGLVNVVDDHGSYDFAAVMLFREATCQGRGADFRDVLMLCDGGDLVLLKATEADAVLQ
jgi:hypothetical protein